MTSIRTTCPRCGEVEMAAQTIQLELPPGGREGSYRFVCPGCLEVVQKAADTKVVELLLTAGVEVRRDAPTGTLEVRPDGPPFTPDDLIDFHFLLASEDELSQLASTD